MKFSPSLSLLLCFGMLLFSCHGKTEERQNASPLETTAPTMESPKIEKSTPKESIKKPVKTTPKRAPKKKKKIATRDTLRPIRAR
ncbi:MAG: hypothetical protein WBG90_08585 [Saonia sp.]